MPTQMELKRVVNVASVPHRSPFRYPGGKTWLVPTIRKWLGSYAVSPHQLAEPFAGGGIVGLSALFEGLCNRLTLVELDENVGAVWQAALGSSFGRLIARISEFEVTHDNVVKELNRSPRSTIDRAFKTIVRNRMQRGGILAPGASLMKSGENGKGLLSRWYPETLGRRLRDIAAHRDSICFISGDGLDYIESHSHDTDVTFFVDPPYTVAGRRLYSHSQLDHDHLFELMSSVRGDFLMTYDNVPFVRSLAKRHGFQMEAISMKNTHHSVMSELLIGRKLEWLGSSSNLLPQSLFKDGK